MIKRRKPLARSTKPLKRTKLKARTKPLARGKTLAKNRKPIRAKGKRRFKGTEDRKFLTFVRLQPCVVCHTDGGLPFGANPLPCRWGETLDACHVRTKAQGVHDLGNVVPMHHSAHMKQHRIGKQSFEAKYGIDMQAEAEKLAARYRAERAL